MTLCLVGGLAVPAGFAFVPALLHWVLGPHHFRSLLLLCSPPSLPKVPSITCVFILPVTRVTIWCLVSVGFMSKSNYPKWCRQNLICCTLFSWISRFPLGRSACTFCARPFPADAVLQRSVIFSQSTLFACPTALFSPPSFTNYFRFGYLQYIHLVDDDNGSIPAESGTSAYL